MDCGPTSPAMSTERAGPMVGADACWWPQPWNWLAVTLKSIAASRAFSKPWRPGWLVPCPVLRRRANWPMASSPPVPPKFSSVSSRGCAWSAKRHRRGSRRKPPLTRFSTVSSGRHVWTPLLLARQYIWTDRSLKKECHVRHPDRLRCGRPPALGLSVRGHQSRRYGIPASVLPRAALPGHRNAARSARQTSHASTVRPDRGYFAFPRWAELRAVLCWPWARLGKHVGRRLSTRHALHRTVGVATARGEAVSHHVRRSGACIRRRGRVGSRARPLRKRASTAARGRGGLRFRGVQRVDEALRPF